ncbi:MAG: ion transporter [Bacteroidota bacterium]
MLKKFFLTERNIMIAIGINAFIICLLYFPNIHNDEQPNHFLVTIDHLFALLFLIEAIVKIVVEKPRKYFANSWNIFDFIIVVISIPSLLTFIPFFAMHDYGILKVLRLFRMIRMVRFLKFIPHMAMIMAGLSRALKASVFVIIVLLFLNFMLALFTCHFYGEIAPQYFGDPGISAYTIFQLFTVEGWNEIPDVVLKETNNVFLAAFTRFYFVIIVLVGGIFGMSLANAVFVDEMTMDNNAVVEKKIEQLSEQIEELKQMLGDREARSGK